MKVNTPVRMPFAAAMLLTLAGAAPPAGADDTRGASTAPAPSSPSKKSSSSLSSSSSDRVLRTTLVLDAPVEAVWALWTTEEGVRSFFAPGCRIEPRVDGLYEIWFNPSAPPGERGADGMRILSFEPNRRLVFTWNAPPSIPAIRGQRTAVEVKLAPDPSSPKRTRLTFTHFGWGEGEDWDKAYAYFDKAWNGFVLPNLVFRVANGPIDWSKKPEVKPVAPSLRVELAPR